VEAASGNVSFNNACFSSRIFKWKAFVLPAALTFYASYYIYYMKIFKSYYTYITFRISIKN
jgi:hypothetical protein